MAKYFVNREDICTECQGTGWVQHWQWKQFWKEHPENRADGAELERWFLEMNGKNKYGLVNIPDEETICPECEGEKIIRSEVNLVDVLAELGLAQEVAK